MQMEGPVQSAANYIPLSPISFLERSAQVHRDATSLVYGNIRFTWSQTFERCKALASALIHLGISYGHVVAALLPNTPPMYELHFGVPMAGASICPLNTRHDSAMVAQLLEHSEAKMVFVDTQWVHIIEGALKILSETTSTNLPLVVLVRDPMLPSSSSSYDIIMKLQASVHEYDSLLVSSSADGFQVRRPKDELDPISLSFTSGTTSGVPKGVVYSHRGAYLNSIAMVLIMNQQQHPYVYLWTVPMFHCNGWCHAWGMAALGGTNVCLRVANTPDVIFDSIDRHGITHMGGAPAVLNMIVNGTATTTPAAHALDSKKLVWVMVGGAPPPTQLVLEVEKLGFRVIHAYGMTETYGAAAAAMEDEEKHGVFRHVTTEAIDVKDPATMSSVVWDGETMGEVMVRGNTVMSGYFKNKKATLEAFQGGWFRTGDIGVRHHDGGIEFKDRCCDIILSGEDHVSSVEVESVLYKHPTVLEAAVVGKPDDLLGETVCAFVHLKEGFSVKVDELIAFCARHLPEYMVPSTLLFFPELPKTSTGKTHKFLLREKAKQLSSKPST